MQLAVFFLQLKLNIGGGFKFVLIMYGVLMSHVAHRLVWECLSSSPPLSFSTWSVCVQHLTELWIFLYFFLLDITAHMDRDACLIHPHR